MAQKKGLFYRLTMGKDNLPDFTPDKLPGNRFQQFKDVFFGRLGTMLVINLLIILFAVPVILVLFLAYMSRSVDASIVPYSSAYGIATHLVPDAVQIGQARAFIFNFRMYLYLIPCIMVLFIGLSGAFYVMRRLIWGEGTSIAAHFFKGIKQNFLPFLWASLFLGVTFSLTMINITGYAQMTYQPWLKIIVISISVIMFVILLCMAIFMLTQAVTYKLKFMPLVKNSFLMAIGLLPLNIIILLISVLPVVLLLLLMNIQIIGMFILMIFLMLGISFIVLVWTVYAHWAFDKFINDKVPGAVKNRGMYVLSEEEKRAKKERALLSKNTRYRSAAYINRQVSSIDEGTSFTPLSTTYSRADLEKLAEEKEIMKAEIDAEFGDVPVPEEEKPKVKRTAEEKKPVAENNAGQESDNAAPQSPKAKAKFTIRKK